MRWVISRVFRECKEWGLEKHSYYECAMGMLGTKEHKQEMGAGRWKTGSCEKGSAKTQYLWKYHKKPATLSQWKNKKNHI